METNELKMANPDWVGHEFKCEKTGIALRKISLVVNNKKNVSDEFVEYHLVDGENFEVIYESTFDIIKRLLQ